MLNHLLNRCLLTLTLHTLALPASSAELADALKYRLTDAQRWDRVNTELIQTEDYSYRKIRWNVEDIEFVHQVLRQRFVPMYNTLRNLSRQDPSIVIPNLTAQTAEKINHFLEDLPIVEHVSYQSRTINEAYFNAIDVGDGMLEVGLMHGTGSLHQAYAAIQPVANNVTHLILKIESQTGRLVDILHDQNLSVTLWPEHSYFVVLAKDENRLQNTQFLHLKQISTEAASALPKLHAFEDAQQVNLSGKQIVLSCL
jgi:hypothetical protein